MTTYGRILSQSAVSNLRYLKHGLFALIKGSCALMSKYSDNRQTNAAIIILTLSLLLVQMFPEPAAAEMKQLSEIQNGIFHINPKSMEFTAETSITDNFIDDEQLDYFIYTSATEPFLPADDNYPYSVIDFNALGSDLVILYKYDSISCCPYPAKAYLSRHNISIADFTNQQMPPKVFQNVISGQDQIYHEKVKGFYTKVTNNEFSKGEFYNETNAGVTYLLDADCKVVSACISVWKRESHPICEKAEVLPKKSCLPPSAIKQPKVFIMYRLPSTLPCSNDPDWLGPPKCRCLFGPPPPERISPAATNWSYNYNNNFFSDSDDYKQNYKSSSQAKTSDSIYYCPTCK
jgi:hypothetical protein